MAVVDTAAGHDRISPTPMNPTSPIANAIGTRRHISRNMRGEADGGFKHVSARPAAEGH